MIEAVFHRNDGALIGFSIQGHAGYAAYGQDIVCASVSSAAQLTANGVTEILGLPAKVEVEEKTSRLTLALPGGDSPLRKEGERMLEALLLHLQLLEEDYRGKIQVTILEV